MPSSSVLSAIRSIPDRRYDRDRQVNVVPLDRCLEVEAFAESIEAVAGEHFGGIDKGDWGTRGGEDPDARWEGVDAEPDYDGVDEAP
jgi:hypothetical protein